MQDAGPQCVRACVRARARARALSVIPTRTHVTWAPCVRAILCRGFRHQHAPQHETPNAVGSLHHEGHPRATNVCVWVCVCVCVCGVCGGASQVGDSVGLCATAGRRESNGESWRA